MANLAHVAHGNARGSRFSSRRLIVGGWINQDNAVNAIRKDLKDAREKA
jgi:hypothetical protein